MFRSSHQERRRDRIVGVITDAAARLVADENELSGNLMRMLKAAAG
ncbi:hypothetical protein IMCC9480_1655 [Oxalobacteraceae bacterium IMCC9480]|nr:hypothetical protein IMCC9480_1655 [Oxalobacteraceae bacterium IMCC9480]